MMELAVEVGCQNDFWLGARYEDGTVVEKLTLENVNALMLRVNSFIKLGALIGSPIKEIYRVP